MGKTSLCLSVAKKLHNRSDLRSSVVLIQAEAIKKYIAEKKVVAPRIESIYDIYELYSKYQGNAKIFERETFDLAVVCGNLTIIIDGLDEFSSLFQENFDIDSFLESLKKLHDQLGSSSILLTTRNNVVSSANKLDEFSVASYELLGFNPENSKKYIRKRFSKFENSEALLEKVMLQIEKIRLVDPDNRIVPFFADIIATVVEDELRDSKGIDFDLNVDVTPYHSNNDLTDHIIHSILRRENTRHDLGISEKEVVEFICSLVADFGKRWPAAEMRDRLSMMYDVRSHDLYSKISLNPLLVMNGDDFELKYSFLNSYFDVVFILQGILSISLESEFIKSLSKLILESEEAKDLKRFFSKNKSEMLTSLGLLLPKLKKMAVVDESDLVFNSAKEKSRRAISGLLGLYAGVFNGSMENLRCDILNFYGVSVDSPSQIILDGVFIKGDFPAFDFSDITITNSAFYSYKKLLFGKFSKTKFLYTVFDSCAVPNAPNNSLDPLMIDSSCDPGDLKDVFSMWGDNKERETKMIYDEVKKFLDAFFKGGRFIDKKTQHFRFSNKVPGLSLERVNRLVSADYFVIKSEKNVGIFYDVSRNFQASVRRFLTDGYPDGKMKQFIAFVCS